MSRQHDSFYSVATLLEREGRPFDPATVTRHSTRAVEQRLAAETRLIPVVTDVEDPTDLAGPDDEFDNAAQLDHLAYEMRDVGAVVQRPDRDPNGDCLHCDREGALAEITVTSGDVSEEMCRACTPSFVVSEISTGQHRRPVVVEIPAVTV